MRQWLGWRWLFVPLILSACDPVDGVAEIDTGMGDQDVFIASYYKVATQPLEEGADPRVERERIITEIIDKHPELASEDDFLLSLRGDAGWLIISLPPQYTDIAPLVARSYHLLKLEREHLERRRPQSAP